MFAPARYYISKESALTIYIFRHYYTNDAGCDKSAGSDEDHEDKSIPSLQQKQGSIIQRTPDTPVCCQKEECLPQERSPQCYMEGTPGPVKPW